MNELAIPSGFRSLYMIYDGLADPLLGTMYDITYSSMKVVTVLYVAV